MPYASTTGTPNTRSNSAITGGGSADDDERMNRSRWFLSASGLLAARRRIAWCIVGTPVYHVGRTSVNHEKNLSALKPGEQQTSPPAESGAESAAISPCIWKRGMMTSPRSSAVNASVFLMLAADAAMFLCASGTILGRDVVPDVCSTSAMESGPTREEFGERAGGGCCLSQCC